MIFFTGPSLGARVRVLLITTVSVFLVFQIYNHVDYKTLPFGELHTPVDTPEHTGTASTTLMPTAVDASTTATTSPSPEVHKAPLGALIAAAMHTTDVSWMNELAEKYVVPLLHPYG
jgi:hypothetical protein